MRGGRLHAWLWSLLAAGLIAGGPARGEVSMRVVGDKCESALVMMSIVEDPDPFGSRVWTPYRRSRVTVTINRSGERRGDLFPDLVFDPDACVVQMAWPFRRGHGQHAVVFQQVDAAGPGPVVFLGGPDGTELDPRIYRDPDHAVHVAWWTETLTTREVFIRSRPPGKIKWYPALRVTAPGEQGRQPAVVGLDDALLVVYERLAAVPDGPGEIVVARVRGGEVIAVETIASVDGDVPARPLVHRSGPRVWIDWRVGAEALGYVELTADGWSAPTYLEATGRTWVDLEAARGLTRKQLLGQSAPAPRPLRD